MARRATLLESEDPEPSLRDTGDSSLSLIGVSHSSSFITEEVLAGVDSGWRESDSCEDIEIQALTSGAETYIDDTGSGSETLAFDSVVAMSPGSWTVGQGCVGGGIIPQVGRLSRFMKGCSRDMFPVRSYPLADIARLSKISTI